MAIPANNILLLATDALGGDGFTNKEVPVSPVLTEGYGKQSLPYQQYNYTIHNFGEWLKYMNEEQIPDADQALQDQIDDINNTNIDNAITTALTARDNARYPVGHILLTMTSTNPASGGYPGTWSLLYEADADIKLGDGTNQSGTSTGDNNPNVPLKDHDHTASFSGNALPVHKHTASIPSDGTPDGGTDVSSASPSGSYKDEDTSEVSAGTPSGSVTVDPTGDGASPTIDVKGKGIAINVWERTA